MLALLKAILTFLLLIVLPQQTSLPPDGIRSIQLPVGSGPPEIVVKNGNAHIAYSADGWGQVTYRKIDAFGEQIELVDGEIKLGAALTSIAVTSFDNPSIIYSGEYPEGLAESLYIAKRYGPGDWRTERIISGIDIREHFRIIYDEDNQEHIVFYSWQPENERWTIYHINRNGWGWTLNEIYSLPDSRYSIPAVDFAMINGTIHIVAAIWDIATGIFQYLYFDGNNPPIIIRSAVSGSWIAYYRTLILKTDNNNGIHLLSCFESYDIPIPGENQGFYTATYSIYGFKPFDREWQDIEFVHQEYEQSSAQAIMAVENEDEVYHLADIGKSIALFSKSQTGWAITNNALNGEWLDSADMAVFNDSLLIVYPLREQFDNNIVD